MQISSQWTTNDSTRTDTVWLFSTGFFVVALAFYVVTLSHTVFWWDSGELSANANVLGIAHRPGFPLYVIFAHIFGLIPFGSYFYRINFISAAAAAVTLGIAGYIWAQLVTTRLKATSSWETLAPVAIALVALGGTYTYWIQAVRAEVYAPNILLIALLLACAWRFERDSQMDSPAAGRWFLAAAFLSGLGMGMHHATFASVLPSFLVFFIASHRPRRLGLNTWLAGAALAILGLSIYLYMPLRAHQNPALNWGWTHVANAPGWSAVIAADSYKDIAQTTPAQLLARIAAIGALIQDQYQWGLLMFAVVGMWRWWNRARRWVLLSCGMLLGDILVTAALVSDFSETNADIHGYLLPAMLAVAFLTVGGAFALSQMLTGLARRYLPTRGIRRTLWIASSAMVVLLALAPAIIYAPFCNLSRNRLAHDFGTESIASLRPNAIVILAGTNWDFVLRGLRYVDGWRPDLTVINRDLLPAAWYRAWLLEKHPELASYPIPSDSVRLQPRLWAKNLAAAGFPVYWEFTETDHDMISQLVPAGHLFEVTSKPVDVLGPGLMADQEEFERKSQFYGAAERITYDYDAKMVWVLNLYRAGMYYESRGLLGRAKELYQRALSFAPDDEKIFAGYVRCAPDHGLYSLSSRLSNLGKSGRRRSSS